MKIRPLQGQVLLRMDKPDAASPGGIIIPEIDREPAETGVVQRCGIWKMNKRGCLLPFPVHRGQRVVINKRVGRWVRGENVGLKLIHMENILAVIP